MRITSYFTDSNVASRLEIMTGHSPFSSYSAYSPPDKSMSSNLVPSICAKEGSCFQTFMHNKAARTWTISLFIVSELGEKMLDCMIIIKGLVYQVMFFVVFNLIVLNFHASISEILMLDVISIKNDTHWTLGITNLHNGMILSSLSISSHGFVFCFLKRPHANGDVFLINP